MGKILLNGIEYSGLSVINGMFIDTDNVITSGTITAGSSISYTATADCAFDFLAYSSGGSNAFLQIDGKNIFTSSASTNRNTFLIKKGQVVTVGSHGTNGSYTVYGLKQGASVSGASVNYSTTEQVVGTYLGKPLYEITVDTGTLPNNTTKTIAHGISDLKAVIDLRGYARNTNNGINIPIPYVYKSGSYSKSLQAYSDATNITLISGENMSGYTESSVTLQYTKTTD